MKIKTVLIFILVFTICIVFFIAYKQLFLKRDISKETIAYKVSANELFQEFENNQATATFKYNNKVIEVKGVISEIIKNQNNKIIIILKGKDEMFGVNCSLDSMSNEQTILKQGDSIYLTGILQGYLDDVILNNCIIKKTK